jgi:hypothetical protein
MAQVLSILDNANSIVSPMRGQAPNQQASGADFGAQVGQALTGFSDQVGALAATVAQEQAKRQSFTEEASFIDFQSQQQEAFTEAARTAEGTNALGFTSLQMTNLDRTFGAWSKANPTANPEKRKAQYAEFRATMGRQALVTELQTTDKFYATQIGDKLDLYSKGIAQSPAEAETYIKQGEAFIDASGLPDGVKTQLKTGWREAAAAAKANGLLEKNPNALHAALTGVSSATDFANRLAGTESSINGWTATNNVEGSGGKGHYGRLQFSIGRLDEAKAAGIIPKDMTPQQFASDSPEGRSAQLRVEAWHFADIDKYIQEKGYDKAGYSLDGLRAVAHLGGKGGLDKFIQNGGKSDAADANGTTLSKYYHTYASSANTDPVLSNLSYADTLKFTDAATSTVNAQARQTALDQKAAYDGKLNDLLNGLNDGTMGPKAIEAARAEGWLTDYGDINKAQGILTSATAKQKDLTAGLAAINDPNTVWNQFDSDQKKQMNAVATASADPIATGYGIYNKTGIMPDASVAALRKGLVSTDPTEVLNAARIAGNMVAANGNAFAAVGEGGSDLEKAGIEFNRQVNQLGRTPEEAAKILAQENDPTFKANAPKREDVTAFEQQLRKDGVTADITSAFNPGVFSSAPAAALTVEQQSVMDSDYIAFATENFRQYGDQGRAKEYAAAQMKKLYGVSNGRVTKYPPEKAYPAINGGHDYLYSQAAADLKSSTGEDVKPENIYFVPRLRGATAEAWRQGRQVPYEVTYLTEDPETGQMIFHTAPKMFVGDTKAPMAAEAERRKTEFEAARTESAYAAWQDQKSRRDMQQKMIADGLWQVAPSDIIPDPGPAPKAPPSVVQKQRDALPQPENPIVEPGTFTDPMTGWSQ